MTKKWARAALTHPAFCGVSRTHLGDLIEELAAPWLARCESELREFGTHRGLVVHAPRAVRARPQQTKRICVEHANAELYAETHQAIASLVSDRLARRPTRRKPSTELVLAWQSAC
ncbi:hypothetical protein [Streptomyces sp. NPDC047453]|uniref:hypothetical protein n=1 Tax=Streptomyces sp. NPDC047453 TaxID=3154812 RepID=UPI00340ADFFF